jgi:hypothetical protein
LSAASTARFRSSVLVMSQVKGRTEAGCLGKLQDLIEVFDTVELDKYLYSARMARFSRPA